MLEFYPSSFCLFGSLHYYSLSCRLVWQADCKTDSKLKIKSTDNCKAKSSIFSFVFFWSFNILEKDRSPWTKSVMRRLILSTRRERIEKLLIMLTSANGTDGLLLFPFVFGPVFVPCCCFYGHLLFFVWKHLTRVHYEWQVGWLTVRCFRVCFLFVCFMASANGKW